MTELKPEKKQLPLRPGRFVVPEKIGSKPYLTATKCRNCGEYFTQNRVICLNCGKQEMEKVALKGTGNIYSFTIVHQQLPGALVKVPYAIVQVALDEGCLMQGVMTEDFQDLKLDMPVEVYFVKMKEDDEGNDLIAYKFRPVKG